MTTPTPRTDLEIDGLVNGLNHMADDHLCCRATVLDTIELIKELRSERDQLLKELSNKTGYAHLVAERDQLRKVCDEFAIPYVLERNTK